MPRRIHIVHRVVGGVGVQVLCPRAVYVSLERILLQEPPRVRVVVPAPQVVCPAVIQRGAFSSSFYQTTKEKGHILVPFSHSPELSLGSGLTFLSPSFHFSQSFSGHLPNFFNRSISTRNSFAIMRYVSPAFVSISTAVNSDSFSGSISQYL